jgi:hypothetical protein
MERRRRSRGSIGRVGAGAATCDEGGAVCASEGVTDAATKRPTVTIAPVLTIPVLTD